MSKLLYDTVIVRILRVAYDRYRRITMCVSQSSASYYFCKYVNGIKTKEICNNLWKRLYHWQQGMQHHPTPSNYSKNSMI
jgi:hypothetical protein